MRYTNKQTRQPGKPHNGDSVVSVTASLVERDGQNITPLLHRRAAEIHTRIRTTEANLKPSELAVYRYIVNNTIGRNKDSDRIANSQFTMGKRCNQTGQVIDFGCGLRSINAVRRARKSLIDKGIIFSEVTTDVTGASSPNRYGLTFLRDLIELHQLKQRAAATRAGTRANTHRGYHEKHPTIKSSSKIENQRCRTTAKITKKKKAPGHYMHRDHVDYLTDQIEATTGDTHSRGAFAEIALTVDEGVIMELLAVLRDRTNISNPGAWFLVAARKYQRKRIIKADAPDPRQTHDTIPAGVSLRDLLADRKPKLAELLDMNQMLSAHAVHQKFIVGK